MFSRCQW